MEESLNNLRKVTFNQIIKTNLLRLRYRGQLKINGAVRILGRTPVLKLPGNSKIILGNKVVLNSDDNHSNTALTFRCTLACGLNGIIEIGDGTMMNGVSITSYEKVSIGRNCQIASCTFIADTDFHPINPKIREREVMGYKIDHSVVNKKTILIGNNVWIGWGTIILKGVTIGDNCVVAAGSVVLSSFPSNVLIAGNPAVIKREFKY